MRAYNYDRIKVARLPAGSTWYGASGGKKWALAQTKKGEFKIRVLDTELRVNVPEKGEYRWRGSFRKKEEALKEGERVAQSIKKKGDFSLAGWKKL